MASGRTSSACLSFPQEASRTGRNHREAVACVTEVPILIAISCYVGSGTF